VQRRKREAGGGGRGEGERERDRDKERDRERGSKRERDWEKERERMWGDIPLGGWASGDNLPACFSSLCDLNQTWCSSPLASPCSRFVNESIPDTTRRHALTCFGPKPYPLNHKP
jgi:hypothetical protein